jgi:nitroreductase
LDVRNGPENENRLISPAHSYIIQVIGGIGLNEILQNIYARRSVRAYSDRKVPEEIVREILTAGIHAPTGMNVQPLRFVVVENQEKLDHYSALAKELFIAGLKKGRPQNEPVPRTCRCW